MENEDFDYEEFIDEMAVLQAEMDEALLWEI